MNPKHFDLFIYFSVGLFPELLTYFGFFPIENANIKKEVNILFCTKKNIFVKHLLKLEQCMFGQKDLWSISFWIALLIKNIKIYLFCV